MGGLVDRRFQIKELLRRTSASVVVFNVMFISAHDEPGDCRRHIGALPFAGAVPDTILVRNGEEISSCKIADQCLERCRLDPPLLVASNLHMFIAGVCDTAIAMNGEFVGGARSITPLALQDDGRIFGQHQRVKPGQEP